MVEYFVGDDLIQVIYHGSNQKIKEPKIIETKFSKDFGKGFYCTILEDQAIKWAKKYDNGVVNLYEYNENLELKIKEFTIMSEEWLDFIIDSRNGKTHDYDIVIGVIAYNQVYNYINDYLENKITREAFWQLAKFNHPTHQIAFCTSKALECIKYIDSRVV